MRFWNACEHTFWNALFKNAFVRRLWNTFKILPKRYVETLFGKALLKCFEAGVLKCFENVVERFDASPNNFQNALLKQRFLKAPF